MTDYEDYEPNSDTANCDKMQITIDVPVPTIDNVAGQAARQVIASLGYRSNEIVAFARERMGSLINDVIEAKAKPIIEEMLRKPLQPTDGFGVPIGEPVSLETLLAMRIDAWAGEPVDVHGNPKKKDAYNSTAPRFSYVLNKIIDDKLKRAVDDEVKKIAAQLKEEGTAVIARRIAEKISGLVIK